MKVAEPDAARDGASMSKKKWDDVVYFLSQDRCFADMKLRPSRAAHRLVAIMGFVRTTYVLGG